jgi:hypothetical protein
MKNEIWGIYFKKKWFGWVFMNQNGSYGESTLQQFENFDKFLILFEFVLACMSCVEGVTIFE